jgi:hypothetical protein
MTQKEFESRTGMILTSEEFDFEILICANYVDLGSTTILILIE